MHCPNCNQRIRDPNNPNRNLQDRFIAWTNDLIKERLKEEAFPFAVLGSHIQGDMNFSGIIRSSNLLNASKIYYYGKKRYDRRGSVGTHLYSQVVYLPTFEDIVDLKKQYTFVALETGVDAVPMAAYKWPVAPKRPPLMVFGEEGLGIEQELLDLCDEKVAIEMFGSCRSYNVSIAASIAMYDYVRKVHI